MVKSLVARVLISNLFPSLWSVRIAQGQVPMT
jgi:hypothetical protein